MNSEVGSFVNKCNYLVVGSGFPLCLLFAPPCHSVAKNCRRAGDKPEGAKDFGPGPGWRCSFHKLGYGLGVNISTGTAPLFYVETP